MVGKTVIKYINLIDMLLKLFTTLLIVILSVPW